MPNFDDLLCEDMEMEDELDAIIDDDLLDSVIDSESENESASIDLFNDPITT